MFLELHFYEFSLLILRFLIDSLLTKPVGGMLHKKPFIPQPFSFVFTWLPVLNGIRFKVFSHERKDKKNERVSKRKWNPAEGNFSLNGLV